MQYMLLCTILSAMATDNTAREPSVVGVDDGTALWAFGALIVFKVNAEQTDGALTLVEYTAPSGNESPFHVHHNEDELFYVLSGEIVCYYGDDAENRIRAGPSETVLLPRAVPHGFRVVSDEACRLLVQITPGGLEAFFAEVGTPAAQRAPPPPAEPDVAAMTEAAEAYGIEILGPLPRED